MRSFPEVTLDDVEHHECPYVEIAALTHPGAVRANNEDQYAIIRRSRQSEVLAKSFSLGEPEIQEEHIEAFWLLVADGSGSWVVSRGSKDSLRLQYLGKQSEALEC